MNRKVRRGAFETNSSSSHSLTIAAGDYIPDKLPVVDGVCEIRTGEFGWGFDLFRDSATKAAYCLTYIKSLRLSGSREAEMLAAAVKSVTGATEVKFVPETGEFYPWGYIDHQSHGVCAEAFADEESLARFIFNPRSLLVIDNDNL